MGNDIRVLLIGHNVLDTRTAFGKTLASFFRNWNPDCLAELYFHSEVPTTQLCKKYYRITDTDVLHSIVARSNNVGREFDEKDIQPGRKSSRTDEGLKKSIYSFGRKRTPMIYLARNTMWKLSKWYSNALIEWIDEFNPEVIFFAAGDYAFAYEIAYKIAVDRKIPIVMYCCDDYFVNRLNPDKFLSNVVYRGFMKSVRKCMRETSNMITICDKMRVEYAKLFSKPIRTVYTGYSVKGENCYDGSSVVYLGNLGFDRYETLIDIGRALKKISQKLGRDLYLDVYSAETRKEIVEKLTSENGIHFHGAVSSDEVNQIIARSGLVVHTESFQKKNIYKVRFSVSTKVADLLASGHCIFAYGPKEIASMEYLSENKAAYIVHDKDRLEDALNDILSDLPKRKNMIEQAKILAEKNHNPQKVISQIEDAIQDALKG